MATIVNNPAPASESSGDNGMFIGIFVLLVLLVIFLIYGLPLLKQSSSPQTGVPSKVNVNVNQPGK